MVKNGTKPNSDGLVKLEHYMSCGNLENIQQYFSDANSVSDQDTEEEDEEKIPNLVIAACKLDRLDCLKYLMSQGTVETIIKVNREFFKPEDEDDAGHNAFYYSVRSFNTNLLDFLVTKWPDDNLTLETLDRLLSDTYQELVVLNNISLPEQMRVYVLSKLLDLRLNCFSPVSVVYNFVSIKGRIVLLSDYIKKVLRFSEVNETCLYLLTSITKNMYILKQIVRCSYQVLPWEEIEFLTLVFVSSMRAKVIHMDDKFLGYVISKDRIFHLFGLAVLNFTKIKDHLRTFVERLDNVELSSIGVEMMQVLPKSTREETVRTIEQSYPSFHYLYRDYLCLRDLYSLRKIKEALDLALSVDPLQQEGKLAIFRSLQIVGEFLKNTLESPKLSNTIVDLLLLSLPIETRKIIIQLRNAFSYTHFLLKRLEIEKDVAVWTRIQMEFIHFSEAVTTIILKKEADVLANFLKEIIKVTDMPDLEKLLKILKPILMYLLSEGSLNKMVDKVTQVRLCNLVAELNENIKNKTMYEKQIFDQLSEILVHKKSIPSNKANAIEGLILLNLIARVESVVRGDKHGAEISDYQGLLDCVRCNANMMLRRLNVELGEDLVGSQLFVKLVGELFESILPRSTGDSVENIKLFLEIYNLFNLDCNRKGIVEETLQRLTTRNTTVSSWTDTNDLRQTFYDRIPKELENLLRGRNIMEEGSALKSSLADKKFLAALEVLLLDLMSIMESESKLKNNLMSLDDSFYTLTGKCLRNYIAHGNYLIDVLTGETELARIRILNAVKLARRDVSYVRRKHETWCHGFMPKSILERDINLIRNKLKMFSLLESGDLEGVRLIINKGAEVLSRDLCLRTCFHYAAKAPDAAVIDLLVELNARAKSKSIASESALHVAAEYGRTEVADFLIKLGLNVNESDSDYRTPLHLASRNGHAETVALLIRNEGDLWSLDICGKLPLHCAIENNHRNVVDLLLAAELQGESYLDESNFSSLILASENGYLELVEYLLLRGSDVNFIDDFVGSALSRACLNGRYKVAELLIKHGANVNEVSVGGLTPLYNATEFNHNNVVNLLLRSGARVNMKTEGGITPLFLACTYGFNKIVQSLLRHGADTNMSPELESLPFLKSVMNNHKDVVLTLIKHGIDVNIRTWRDYSALHLAALNGFVDLIHLLIKEKADMNSKNCDFSTPLHIASAARDYQVMDYLIKKGANMNAENFRGSTPLHIAAKYDYNDIVFLLIQNKAQLDSLDKEGSSALHVAAAHGAKRVVELLTLNSVKINLTGPCGLTPLHMACHHGQTKVVDFLLKRGAEVNKPSQASPLFLAVEGGHRDTVIHLLKMGANLGSTEENKTIVLIAIRNHRKDILSLLQANGISFPQEKALLIEAILSDNNGTVNILLKNKLNAEFIVNFNDYDLDKVFTSSWIKQISEGSTNESLRHTPLLLASSLGRKDIVEMLILSGANLNAIDSNGNSALHLAAAYGHSEVVRVLLNTGMTNNMKDFGRRTAFELAVGRGHASTVDVFLSHMDDEIVNSRGTNNWTPLHIASQSGYLNIVVSLVAHGADIHLRNRSGSKPVHIAARDGHINLVQYFLSQGMHVDELGFSDHTLLHYAAMLGRLDVVEFLARNRADPNAIDSNGYSPLHLAASKDHVDVVRYLLEVGSYCDATNVNLTDSPKVQQILDITKQLFSAVKKKDCPSVNILVGKGAVINAVHSEHGSALHYATFKGYDGVAGTLLRNRCNPNVRGKNGLRPIHYATKFCQYRIFLSLMTNGAEYDALSDSGKTPLDLCPEKKISNLIVVLNECFKKVKDKDVSVVDDIRLIKEAVVLNALTKAQNREGKNLMEHAVTSEFPKIKDLMEILKGNFSSQDVSSNRLGHQEKYVSQLDFYKAILKCKKGLLEDANQGISDVENIINKVLFDKLNHEESVHQLKSIYENQKRLLGEDNQNTLNTSSVIALVLITMGRYDESLSILENVSRKQKERSGRGLEDYVETLTYISLVLSALGRHQDALQVNFEILEHKKRIHGDNDTRTLVSYSNVAKVLKCLDRHEEAIRIDITVKDRMLNVLGPSHCDTLRLLQNIDVVPTSTDIPVEALKSLFDVLGRKNPPGLTNQEHSQIDMDNILCNVDNLIEILKLSKECREETKY